MIRLVEVSVELRTQEGAVVGTMSFAPGLQVFTGKNRIGKSTAFTAIVWCLGVEHIFGTIANDASIFPDAVKAGSRVLFGPPGDDTDGEVVIESRARLVLMRDDGDVLTLTRGITADPERVRFDRAAKSGTLTVGYGSFGDETAGFQAALRAWARIPNAMLTSRTRGKEVPIYLENLAPLFIIEQLAGWSDIHAEQVHRYGTIEIDAGAVELLLGEEERLRARLEQQMATAALNGLRAEARQIAVEVAELFKTQGWQGEIGTGGTLEQLLIRWRQLDLAAIASEQFNYDSDRERTTLRQRVDSLRETITKGKIDTKSTVEVNEASANVVALKQRHHDREQMLASLNAQHSEQRRLLATTNARHKSANDLQRLKTRGIGILPRAECPTCHQSVDPDTLELATHTPQSLEVHVDQLDHERSMLEANVRRLDGEILDVRTQLRRIEEELRASQTTLNMVNHAVGPARETLIKLSNDLVTAERELQAANALHDRFSTLQGWLAGWVKRATAVVEPSAMADEMPHRDRFLETFRRYAIDLGCAGVPAAAAGEIRFDEQYVPTFRNRLLRSFGSASDRARLVTAYVTALLVAGSCHPGFLVLDEPLQQNPDEDHLELFERFLHEQAKIDRQVIIFTSLDEDQIERLEAGGVKVNELEGRFLRRVSR